MISRRTFLNLAATLVVALAASAGGRAGATLVTDGFTNPNPSAFTYGRYGSPQTPFAGTIDPTTFSRFSKSGDLGTLNNNSHYNGLLYEKDASDIDPNVIYNSTSKAILTAPDYGDITFNPHELTFGPYQGPTVARFTAKAAGTYDISALFTPVQIGNTLPRDYVFINGVVTSALASSPSGASSFSDKVTLGVGGTVDFVVFGGNVDNKTTQVDGSVVAVPEPASLAMCATALASLAGVAMRRKRNSRADEA